MAETAAERLRKKNQARLDEANRVAQEQRDREAKENQDRIDAENARVAQEQRDREAKENQDRIDAENARVAQEQRDREAQENQAKAVEIAEAKEAVEAAYAEATSGLTLTEDLLKTIDVVLSDDNLVLEFYNNIKNVSPEDRISFISEIRQDLISNGATETANTGQSNAGQDNATGSDNVNPGDTTGSDNVNSGDTTGSDNVNQGDATGSDNVNQGDATTNKILNLFTNENFKNSELFNNLKALLENNTNDITTQLGKEFKAAETLINPSVEEQTKTAQAVFEIVVNDDNANILLPFTNLVFKQMKSGDLAINSETLEIYESLQCTALEKLTSFKDVADKAALYGYSISTTEAENPIKCDLEIGQEGSKTYYLSFLGSNELSEAVN